MNGRGCVLKGKSLSKLTRMQLVLLFNTKSHIIILLLLFSCEVSVQLFATPWTTARQTPLSMGFLRQEYWSGLPFPSVGDLPDSGPGSPALIGRFFTPETPGKAHN